MVEFAEPEPGEVDPYARAIELIYLHESGERVGALEDKPGVIFVNMVSHSMSGSSSDLLVRCDACGDNAHWQTNSGREIQAARQWCENHRRACSVLVALMDLRRNPQCVAPGCTAKRTSHLYCAQDGLSSIAPAAEVQGEALVNDSAARVLNRIAEDLRLSGQDVGASAIERLLQAVGDADDASRVREYLAFCTALAPPDAPAVAEALKWALRRSGHPLSDNTV